MAGQPLTAARARAPGAQGRDGWDITRALAAVKAQAKLDGQPQSQRAAAAVEERVAQARGLRPGRSASGGRAVPMLVPYPTLARQVGLDYLCIHPNPNPLAQVGPDYFRIHPKGVGMVVARPAGLPALTFVEEYLGEVHAPWRWFEIQACGPPGAPAPRQPHGSPPCGGVPGRGARALAL